MSGWDEAQRVVNDADADAPRTFVRLKDKGDKVVGAFAGEPLVRKVHWSERNQRYAECDGDKCSACANGAKPSVRALLNFYVPAEKTMKVIEAGVVMFKDILKVREKYGLEKWLFEIERLGRANDPKTKYTVLPDAQISAKLLAEIQKQDLHDLKATVTGKQPPREAEEESDDATPAGLIDTETAAALVGRIKALPDPAVAIETFRKKFGVKKAIELKAGQAAAVDAWLRMEENSNGADDI